MAYKLYRTGDNVRDLLNAVASLDIQYNTTAYWNAYTGYIPPAGSIIVYTDAASEVVNGQTVYHPRFKIGSGNGYVQDLAFVDTVEDTLYDHIEDTVAHLTSTERTFWNNKLNVNDNQEVVENVLIFNRD